MSLSPFFQNRAARTWLHPECGEHDTKTITLGNLDAIRFKLLNCEVTETHRILTIFAPVY